MLHNFRQKYLLNFWNLTNTIIALGIISAVYFGIFGGVWAVTGEMTRWGGEFLELFGVDLSDYSYYKKQNLNGTPLSRTDGMMLIGMFFGAIVAAFWANKVKFRLPASRVRVFQAIVGGILSGFGARLAFGCNLANFFTGNPYFSLHTWVFTIFMVLGIFVSVKVCNMPIFRPKVMLEKFGTNGLGIEKDKNRANRHFIYGSLIFIAFLAWFFYELYISPSFDIKNKKSLLALALFFGFVFGFLISKGQVCFTSCFRDLFLFGRDVASKAIVYAMIISCLIAFAFMVNGATAKVVEISPTIAVGAFLFGFGIVFAGGCECGWTYRAVEGQLHFIIVGLANVAGTMILALNYDYFPKIFTDGVKINLLQNFTPLGGLAINLMFFGIMLGFILIFKRRFFAKGA